MKEKYDLLSAEETAKILGINLNKLYGICANFDAYDDDEWDLVEGEHFEWLSKNYSTRRFYESGAMILAKYLHEKQTSNPLSNFIDSVVEKLTHRRKHIRKMLVRRRVVSELQNSDSYIAHNNLVFIDRPKVIRILDTNGKGLNYAAKREQENSGLTGREPMELGVHYDTIDGVECWSQRGIARIGQNMSEKLGKKSRRAWADAVFEIIEDAIDQQKKYLDSSDSRIQSAMKQAKLNARNTCQVTRKKQAPTDTFELHVHHLFDRSNRDDLADYSENLLVMHEEIHDGFHNWHGTSPCEPKHFVEYLSTVESWRFSTPAKETKLHRLINKLEKLQINFEAHRHLI
ncbi:MAG: hypothetical protein WA902_06085 [Thermosynechococcaceae cyanobacterium]